MKHSLFLVTLILITGCASVKEMSLAPRYKTIRDYMNGPVKSNWEFDSIYLRDTMDQDQFLVEQHNGERFGAPDFMTYYQRDGRFERSFRAKSDSVIKLDDGFRGGGRFYFQNDFEEKRRYLQPRWLRNVYNPYEIKLHWYRCSVENINKEGQYIKSDCQSVKTFSEYEFDRENITKERRYFGKYDSTHDNFQYKKLVYTVIWNYNQKGQVIRKDYQLEPDDFSCTIDHNLEVSPKRHTPVETYTYDDQGRLTSLKTYKYKERVENGGFAAFWENYFYEGDRLVRKTTRFVKGAQAFLEGVKALRELYYNEQGDVIKIEAKNIDGSIYQTYYYEYEYDHYNNWVKCRKYINQKTKIPHNVLTRVITYYEEDGNHKT